MKKLLVILLISICVIGMRNKEFMAKLGLAGTSHQESQALSIQAFLDDEKKEQHRAMSMQELIDLSKTDPGAVQKFLQSHEAPQERGEVDKLMNLLARGKYE